VSAASTAPSLAKIPNAIVIRASLDFFQGYRVCLSARGFSDVAKELPVCLYIFKLTHRTTAVDAAVLDV